MGTSTTTVTTQKEKLLLKMGQIQAKIDAIENLRSLKITKLAKKFKLLELDDATIEKEFSLIQEKHAAFLSTNPEGGDIKKN